MNFRATTVATLATLTLALAMPNAYGGAKGPVTNDAVGDTTGETKSKVVRRHADATRVHVIYANEPVSDGTEPGLTFNTYTKAVSQKAYVTFTVRGTITKRSGKTKRLYLQFRNEYGKITAKGELNGKLIGVVRTDIEYDTHRMAVTPVDRRLRYLKRFDGTVKTSAYIPYKSTAFDRVPSVTYIAP